MRENPGGFSGAIDRLLKEAERGELADDVRVIYVSPLKALSNDIQRNIQGPLEQIHGRLARGRPKPTGDGLPMGR